MNLLVTLPIWKDNAARAEQLIDLIGRLDPLPQGHVLLAFHSSVHEEMRERIKISAEIAFEGVHILEIRPLSNSTDPKPQHINKTFTQVATAVKSGFKWPFLWLEPDCTPLVSGWLAKLEEAYENQPKQFMGNRMKIAGDKDKPEFHFMSRVGIYPNNVVEVIFDDERQTFFEIAVGATVAPKLASSKLFQPLQVMLPEDLAKIRPDAVLLHGDKNGVVLSSVQDKLKPKPAAPQNGEVRVSRRMKREAEKAT